MKEKIVFYWQQRAENFGNLRERELQSTKAVLWLKEIERHIPNQKMLKILDVGTGGGFFSILLAGLGHQVTGIDLTKEMVDKARQLADSMDNAPEFLVMDAEELEFGEETFDIVISRNLTWTLTDADKAYREWIRVLKPGGLVLNFDADYAGDSQEPEELPENHAHRTMEKELLDQCSEIQKLLDISYLKRPAYDVQALLDAGAAEIKVEVKISERIYREIDEFYNPVPMFALAAGKAQDKEC